MLLAGSVAPDASVDNRPAGGQRVMMGNGLEWLAAALLLVNVWLVAKRSLWSYAFGIAAVLLYAWIFWNAQLYAAFGMQFLFLALNLYGLWNWRQTASEGEIVVGWLRWPARLLTLLGILILTIGLGWLLRTTTDANAPHWDSANTVFSLAAQWWQARRRVETWVLWIAVNISSIGLYATEGLWPTAIAYGLLLALSAKGLMDWKRVAQ